MTRRPWRGSASALIAREIAPKRRPTLSEVRGLKPAEVRSAVSFKTGPYAPDSYSFETDNFIILPWDREIIQGGELVMRPDYAARL
jgi:hypothetical protein